MERYKNLDFIRVICLFGITSMHVLANINYVPDFSPTIISFVGSFGNYVYMFMILSSFCLCCSYREKLLKGTFDIEEFYIRRIKKIWPFFAFLVILDLIVSPSVNSIYEAFANLTLCFGLLPNPKFEVIGVGWFIGTIFCFYIIFPFFNFLIQNKKRAWATLAMSIIYYLFCKEYYMDSNHVVIDYWEKTNILYVFMFFVCGGIIYLYRKQLANISKNHKSFILVILFFEFFLYHYVIQNNLIFIALYFSSIIIFFLGVSENNKLCNNSLVSNINAISYEMYLSNMVIFRVLEKINLLKILNSNNLSYIVLVFLVLIMTAFFSLLMKRIINIVLNAIIN